MHLANTLLARVSTFEKTTQRPMQQETPIALKGKSIVPLYVI